MPLMILFSNTRCIQMVMLLSAIGFSSIGYAGAWVPAKGEGYQKLGISSYEATDQFGDDTSGAGEPGFVSFKGTNYSFYVEHGLQDNLGFFASFLYQEIEQTDTAGITLTNSGIGDVEFGFRSRLNDSGSANVFSAAFTVKLPSFYDEDDELPLGNGQLDYEARILYGRSLYPYGYIGVEAAYRFRDEAPSDEFRYLIEYGISAGKHLSFRAKLDAIASLGNADTVSNGQGQNLSVTPEFDLGKFEFTVGWRFNPSSNGSKWGLEATYNKDLYGDSALNGDGFQIGLTRVY